MTRLVSALFLCLAATTACGDARGTSSQQPDPSELRAPQCDVPKTGPIPMERLPEGSSVVTCDAVGRTVVWRGAGVTVPSSGEGLDIFTEQIAPDSAPPGSFGIFVSADGIVSYEFHDVP